MEALRRQGWDVDLVPERDGPPAPADVVVLQRVTAVDTPALIADLQQHGSLVVYDIDDWYDNVPGYNPAGRHIVKIIDVVHASMRAADLITCSTPELAEGYSRFGPTVVLPNFLDPYLWAEAELAKFRKPRNKVHVGWAGHVDYRSGDLDLLRPWLPGWLADRSDEVRFVACGGPKICEYLGVVGLDAMTSPPTESGEYFRPYDHLPAMLAWLDVGLVPLAQNRFNQAKSWCKGMEYNAAGAPCVASPLREYRQYVRPGVNGLFGRPGTWGRQLDLILDDLDGYQQRARTVAEEHMIDRHIGRWVDAYERVRVAA